MKLTIELVPSSCFYKNVRSEVSTSQWAKIRNKVYADAGNVCEICGGKGPKHPVEAHEIFEYNDETKIQKLVKIMALCPACHRVKHFGLWQMKGMENTLNKHLMKVNGWALEEAKKYVAECFLKWHNRSQCEWSLDLEYLKSEYGIENKDDSEVSDNEI